MYKEYVVDSLLQELNDGVSLDREDDINKMLLILGHTPFSL